MKGVHFLCGWATMIVWLFTLIHLCYLIPLLNAVSFFFEVLPIDQWLILRSFHIYWFIDSIFAFICSLFFCLEGKPCIEGKPNNSLHPLRGGGGSRHQNKIFWTYPKGVWKVSGSACKASISCLERVWEVSSKKIKLQMKEKIDSINIQYQDSDLVLILWRTLSF